jgi:peptidoglycan/LPS O-acetylase OafA/YrhL
MRESRFSLVNFYERRIRRIFPALFVVLAASVVVAYRLFMPPEFVLFGHSALATALFFSNVQFWQEAGYFDTAAHLKPLLHTWSLAVEEQFYLTFPLLLLAIRRWAPARAAQILAILVVAAFALSVWWVARDPVAAFYLAPARFWELGLGCLLALAPRLTLRPMSAAVLALAGLCLIGASWFLLSADSAFPGAGALAPCLGAAMVIAAGASPNAASGLLGVRPMVFVGLISYSLYLWHWPIIVFAQYAQGRALDGLQGLLVVALSFAVATLSWRLVERPVRRRALLSGRTALFGAAGMAMAGACAAGAVIVALGGLPGRLPPEVRAIYEARRDRSPFASDACFTDETNGPTDRDVRGGKLCSVGVGAGAPSFIVWGDSHAAAMAPAVDAAARKYARRGLLAARASCAPLIDYQAASSKQAKRDACISHNAAVLDLIRTSRVTLVFLVARWPREVLGAEYGKEGVFFNPNAPYRITDRSAYVAAALDETLAALARLGVHAVLVMDVPEPGYDVPYALAKAALRHVTPDIDPPRQVVAQRQRQARAILQAAAAKFGADVIDPTARFCDRDRCHVAANGIPYYADADHLTQTAARTLGDLYDPVFAARPRSVD